MSDNDSLALGLVLCGLPIYLLPALLAGLMGHRNWMALFVFNLLLGWTFLGWALAAVWAFWKTEDRHG